MRTKPSAVAAAALAVTALTACPPTLNRTVDDADEDRCVDGAGAWTPGTSLFRERTDLGLEGLTGSRLSAVDVDSTTAAAVRPYSRSIVFITLR